MPARPWKRSAYVSTVATKTTVASCTVPVQDVAHTSAKRPKDWLAEHVEEALLECLVVLFWLIAVMLIAVEDAYYSLTEG